ncbi:MAG: hypothetical protein WBF58_08820 [Xanthobacteraceae bacterium]
MDDLMIPDLLMRPFDDSAKRIVAAAQVRAKPFHYPRDGYLGKGLRAKARQQLRARRRRHAERCRER